MAGRVLAAALFGLRDALDLRRRREETIVEEEPERSDDWLVWLDVDRPDRSLIIVPCADVPHDGVHHVADGGRPPPGTRGVGVGSEG